MRMLDIDINNGFDKLSKITETEATKFLQKGKSIICRTKMREFSEIKDKPDLDRCKRLYEIQVYDLFELYTR